MSAQANRDAEPTIPHGSLTPDSTEMSGRTCPGCVSVHGLVLGPVLPVVSRLYYTPRCTGSMGRSLSDWPRVASPPADRQAVCRCRLGTEDPQRRTPRSEAPPQARPSRPGLIPVNSVIGHLTSPRTRHCHRRRCWLEGAGASNVRGSKREPVCRHTSALCTRTRIGPWATSCCHGCFGLISCSNSSSVISHGG